MTDRRTEEARALDLAVMEVAAVAREIADASWPRRKRWDVGRQDYVHVFEVDEEVLVDLRKAIDAWSAATQALLAGVVERTRAAKDG